MSFEKILQERTRIVRGNEKTGSARDAKAANRARTKNWSR